MSIVSSDDFIGPDTAAERRASAGRCDCFDMESYALRARVRFYADELGGRLPVSAFLKLVSDNADGDAEEWSVRIERLRPRAGRGDRGGRKGVVVDDGEPNIY